MSDVDPVALEQEARLQFRSLRRLSDLVRRSLSLVWQAAPRSFIALTALQVIGAAVLAGQVIAVQATLSAIIEVAQADATWWDLLAPVGALAGLSALTALTATVQTGVGRYLGESVVALMWQRVLAVATGVPLRRFESADFFDRLQRVQTSALTRPYQVTTGLVTTAGAATASIGLVITLFALHPALVPLTVLGGLPILLTSRRESRIEFDFQVRQTPAARMRMYLTLLQTGRDEAKEVRAFSLDRALRSRLDNLYESYLVELAKHLRRRGLVGVIGGLGSALALGATLLVLVWLISVGQLSVASAGAAIVAVRLLAGQVQAVSGGLQAIFESGLFIDDLDIFMAMADDHPLVVSPSAPIGFDRVDAEHVSFAYPGSSAPALQDVTIEVRSGEVVALVGENGSGKTTLAKIVAGLYAPDDGVVRWDGEDARSFEADSQRRRVAVIFQDFVRYAFPAQDNIAFGAVHRPTDLDEIRKAAEVAGAEEFLRDLPDGYDTPLTRIFEGGQELSGGQWQRVALARAFYRDAPLVILDEPTSALDPRAEHQLFSSLRRVLQGRSALFISHRFSTVRSADRIYVLEQGQVVEHGSHEQLMSSNGLYAELFRLQAGAYSADDS